MTHTKNINKISKNLIFSINSYYIMTVGRVRRFSGKKRKKVPKSVLRKKRHSKKKSNKFSTKQKKRKRKVRFSRNASGPNWVHEEPPTMNKQDRKLYKLYDFYEFCYDC